MLNKFLTFFALSMTLFSAHGIAQSQAPTSTIPSNSPLLNPNFSIFLQMAKAAGIIDLFQGTGSYTGFIPNNEAFKKLGTRKISDLLHPENQDKLTMLLIYHVVPGKYLASNLTTQKIKTVNGKDLNIRSENGTIKVNDATILNKDMVTKNGVIHEIDSVLIP